MKESFYMNTLSKENIIQRAVGIFHAEGSIDMVKLAQAVDIDIYAKEDDDAFNSEISFDKTSNKYFIIINANHPLVRQRFSIAHELAHYVLHYQDVQKEGQVSREDQHQDVNKNKEDQADNLAAAMLMPEELINGYRKDHSIERPEKMTEVVINSLAEYFKVSRTVALLRMRHLEYYVPYITFS